MPNIKSAKKRVKTSIKKCANNTLVESRMKNSIKKLEKSISGSDKNVASVELNTALKNIDKALNKNIIKKNKASRDKSRLTKLVNNIK